MASEVIGAFLPKALTDLKLPQVSAKVDSCHIPAIRVLDKLGFEQQGDIYADVLHFRYVFTFDEEELSLVSSSSHA